jgi:hypothetical protein
VIFPRRPILFNFDFIKHGSFRQGVWMQFFYCRKRKNWRAGELNGLNLDHQTKESQVTNYQRKLEYRILPQRRLSIVFSAQSKMAVSKSPSRNRKRRRKFIKRKVESL